MSGYTIKMEELSYDISLAAPEVKLALSRTGGQGSKGDSITSAATVNGELILTVTRADGTTFEINAGAGTSGTSGTPALGEVTDVTLGTLATGEVLQYNGSAWVNTGLNFTDIAGTLADAQVVQSNVTQHQAALNITESQISDLGSYQTADATILKSADIGISVQGFDANLVSDATYVKTDENFTTADHTKLDGIEESATADQTGSEIKALYEAETNAFTDALFTKLAGIEENATADQLSLVEVCKNVSGTTLAAGTVVYQSGTSGNAMEVQAADPTNAAKMPAIGVISSDLVNEAEGEIVLVGFIQAMDTSSFSEGETLYVGATGGLQNTTPTGEGSLIQNIGKVIKVHASNGSVMVTGAGRANAAPNLNDGNIFIGDATNTASTGSLDTLVGNAGYIKDYTPTEAEVTAHQAALSITESQISDFGSYEVADATILKGADIGVNVQAYDANLVSDATYVKTDENFTTADHTKLDGIEAAADVTDTTNVVAALTAGSNITISAGGEIASTDTNTTYVSSDFTHDDLTGFEANEHIDWTINSGSTIHSGNLPAIAITSVQTAADQTAHLALTAQEGDIVVRSDENKSYVHNGGTAGTMADYTLLATPTDTVLSVNGSTGVVTLTHDGFSDYVANEHIDWTADQGATNIHSGNYVNTTYSNLNEFTNGPGYITDYTVTEGDVTAHQAALSVTESQISDLGSYLTAHPSITAASSVNNSGRTYIQDITLDSNGHITGITSATETVVNTNTTYVSSDFNHDDLIGFVANEHIDWTADQGATNIHSGNYTNTTYSVGDGGLTTKDFTAALKTKLDGIATGATNTVGNATHTGEVTGSGALTIASNVVDADNLKVTGNGTTSQFLRSDGDGSFTWATPTDTNTTYSVGDGGLTQKNFTTTLKDKLDGIAAGATNVTNNNQLINGAGYVTSDTTYSAGSGLDLSGTTFSVESDLRGDVFYMGRDTNDYFVSQTDRFQWFLDGNEDMRLVNNGDLHCDGNVVAYSNTTSDERLKKDIVKIDNAVDKVMQLNGYTFEYIHDGKKSGGIIAQEVEKVMPSAVTEMKLPLKSDDDQEYKVVQYDQLHGLLIEAIKELKAEIETLKGN